MSKGTRIKLIFLGVGPHVSVKFRIVFPSSKFQKVQFHACGIADYPAPHDTKSDVGRKCENTRFPKLGRTDTVDVVLSGPAAAQCARPIQAWRARPSRSKHQNGKTNRKQCFNGRLS